MMKKRKIIVLFIGLLVCACCFAAISPFGASASDADNAAYPYYERIGSTENTTLLPDFLLRKSAREQARALMRQAYVSMIDGGFDMGVLWTDQAEGCIRDWSGFGVQEFRGGDHTANKWGRVHGYLVIGAVGENAAAGAVVNEIMLYWTDNTSMLGYPMSNRFRIEGDGAWYQNFQKGYVCERSGRVSFVSGKRIDAQGNVSDRTVVVTETGALNLGEDLPYWADGYESEIEQAFKDAYARTVSTGYRLGGATGEVELWKPENNVLSQTFEGGDNTGNPYGWGAQGRLMLNQGGGKAFALLDSQLTRWASEGGLGTVGYPLSDRYTYGDRDYQAFSNAYMIIEPLLEYSEVVMIAAGQLSLKDRYESALSDGLSNVSMQIFSVYRHYNNTIGNFGVPRDFVRKDGNVYYQAFYTADHGDTDGYIAQKGVYGCAYTVTGTAAAAVKEKGFSVTGAPISAVYSQSGKTYQRFENGYVDFASQTFVGDTTRTETLSPQIGLADTVTAGYTADGLHKDFVAAAEELASRGYTLGDPQPLRIINGHATQYFADASTTDGRIALVQEKPDRAVYAIYGPMLTAFELGGGLFGETEFATGAVFAYGRKVYQNFDGCFAVCNDKGAIQIVSGYTVSPQGEYLDPVFAVPTEDAVPDYVGTYGDINRIPVAYRDRQEEVRAQFRKEYARLMQIGFFPGNPDGELVHQWAPGSQTWLNQTFRNGDSMAEAFGNANAMKIFMMDLDTGACSIIDSMLTAWIAYGSLNGPGYPLENEIYYDGNLYQNFYGGYIVCPSGDADAAVFHVGERFTVPAETESEGMPAWGVVLLSVGCTLVFCGAVCAAAIIIFKKRKAGGV